MSVEVDYKTKNGEERREEFEVDVEAIDLQGWRIEAIDLGPLSSCVHLRLLNLHNNSLRSIDLTPLSSCSALQQVVLSKNELTHIGLSPLGACVNLGALNLDDNQLSALDVSPLSSCLGLEMLTLSKNNLQEINLGPLSGCLGLKYLRIGRNPLKVLDISPLYLMDFYLPDYAELGRCRRISWLPPASKHDSVKGSLYYPPTLNHSWTFLHQVADEFRNDYRVQHDILRALGLADYGFIDSDLTEALLSIPPTVSAESARQMLEPRLVREIVDSIDRDGPTTGMNLERLVHRHEDIALRASRVIDSRMNEIQDFEIPNDCDLRGLWVTAYGFEVLSGLNLGRNCWAEEHSDRFGTRYFALDPLKIVTTFSKLGFEIAGGGSSDGDFPPRVTMSDRLRNCILWIAENMERQWGVIDGSWS